MLNAVLRSANVDPSTQTVLNAVLRSANVDPSTNLVLLLDPRAVLEEDIGAELDPGAMGQAVPGAKAHVDANPAGTQKKERSREKRCTRPFP